MPEQPPIREFLDESRANLVSLDRQMEHAEGAGSDERLIESLLWTLEGLLQGCTLYRYRTVAAITRPTMALLAQIQNGRAVNGKLAALILEVTEALRQLISAITETGLEGPHHYSSLILRLNRLADEGRPEGIPHWPRSSSRGVSGQAEGAGAGRAPEDSVNANGEE